MPELEMATSFVTWESKDGLRYRFNIKRTQNGREMEEVDGRAELERRGGPGVAHFDLPEQTTVPLPAGTVYPTRHTLILIEKAVAGERYHSQPVFDGSELGGPTLVSAVLLPGRAGPPEGAKGALPGTQPAFAIQLDLCSMGETAVLPEFELMVST